MLPPNFRYVRISPPATEPITLDDAKNYARVEVEGGVDDPFLVSAIAAARISCEQRLGLSLVEQSWRMSLDYLPYGVNPWSGNPSTPFFGPLSSGAYNRVVAHDGGITLPRPPLISVDLFRYVSNEGTTIDLDVSTLQLTLGTPGMVYPPYGRAFPFPRSSPSSVVIEYTAGLAPTGAELPENIKMAVRVLVGYYYQNRNVDSPIPRVVEDLLLDSDPCGYA